MIDGYVVAGARRLAAVGTAAGLLVGLMAVPASAQTWGDLNGARLRTTEDALQVQVRYGAGSLELHAEEGTNLYRFDLRYDQDVFEPVHVYDDEVLRIGVRRTEDASNVRTRSGGKLELLLSTEVETHLDMQFGAVQADVDLGGLALAGLMVKTGASESRLDVSRPNTARIREATFEAGAAEFTATNLGNLNAQEIRVDAGVGEVKLDFGGEWNQNADIDLNVGLGSVHLTFPRNLGVRLVRSGFLASVDVDGLDKMDDGYYSPNWESADHRVTVDVTAAFGTVRVEWGR